MNALTNVSRFGDPQITTASHTAETFQQRLAYAAQVAARIICIIDAAQARNDDEIEGFDVANAAALLTALDDAEVVAFRVRDRA